MKEKFLKIILLIFSLVIVAVGGYFIFQKKTAFRHEKTNSSFIEEQKNHYIEIKDNSNPSKETSSEISKNNFEKKNSALIQSVPLQKSELKIEKETEVNKDASTLSVIEKYVSWGFKKIKNGRKIDTIIIHSSYDALGNDPYSLEGLLKEYQQYGVAAHYLIDRQGNVYQLVSDQNIAYHAGDSQTPDKRTNVNFFSLGIELMNTKTDKLTVQQYESLNNLLFYLKKKYKIKYILGHNQIAPNRKTDPWNFNWDKLKFK